MILAQILAQRPRFPSRNLKEALQTQRTKTPEAPV